LLVDNYKLMKRRSLDTMQSTFKHLEDFFCLNTRASRIGSKVDGYVKHRREDGAAEGSIRIELALLNRAFVLAVKKKLLSARTKPFIELPSPDPSAVRKAFFRRSAVENLVQHYRRTSAGSCCSSFFVRGGWAQHDDWNGETTAKRIVRSRSGRNSIRRGTTCKSLSTPRARRN
jgi:hypothetical protein